MTSKEWPDFFIVGAPRAGTTSLHNYLEQVPEIVMCPKGSGYFSKFTNGRIETHEEYKKSFKKASENQLVGDATPMYLRDPNSPKLIHDANSDAKIIILLRDPIERSHSHYLSLLKNEHETESFSKQLQKYLEMTPKSGNFHDYVIMPSFYYDSICNYQKIFGKKQVKIWIYEEFSENTKKIVKEILEFLDLDSEVPKNIRKIYNEYSQPLGSRKKSFVQNQFIRSMAKKIFSKSTRVILRNMLNSNNEKPLLDKTDIKKLHKIFLDDVKKTQKLLDRHLNWQNFTEIQ